jgi:hypothetical protein
MLLRFENSPMLPLKILTPFAVFLLAFSAIAQITTGSLQGLIRDSSGALVRGGQVKVVNVDTNVARTVTSNDVGRFLAPSLQPGRYQVIVEAPGFKRLQREGIILDVNQVQELDLTLNVGEAKETVEVAADAPVLDTASSETGQVVDSHAITNLPLNERNPWQLISLSTGVVGGGTVSDVYNGFNNLVINGGRPGTTALLIDGISAAVALPGTQNTGTSAFPSVDMIQEFKVESNYSAEFGRTGGGVVNLVYKSGTNSLHGSAYEFLRNSDLDSNNFFSNRAGVGLPSFRRNQFGGSVGGPVYLPKLYHGQNKTFFMFGYEALKQSTATTLSTSVPTALETQGNFSQLKAANGAAVVIYDPLTTVASGTNYVRTPFAGSIIPASRIDPVAANVFKYYPAPNQLGNANTGLNNYYVATANPENIYETDGKIDENINDRHRFFIRASRHTYNLPVPHLLPDADLVAESSSATVERFFNGAADYNFTASPTFLTDIRYGYGRVSVGVVPAGAGFDPTKLGFPGYMADGQALMFPVFSATNYYSLGVNAPQEVGTATHSLGIRSTKVLTKHLLKFGFEFLVEQLNDSQGGSGTFSFSPAYTQGPNPNVASAAAGSSLASFLLGAGSGSLAIANEPSTTSKNYAWYLADDWRPTAKLTLNIGFRYSVETPFTERYNRYFWFDPNVTSPLAASTGLANLKGGQEFPGINGNPRTAVPTDFKGWDPRFGFAYHAWTKTVVRGGVGVFHGPSAYQANANSVSGFGATSSFLSSANGLVPTNFLSNPFPGGLLPSTGSSQGLLTNVGTSVTNLFTRNSNRVPYSETWNFNIQHQLPGGMLVELGYQGNHGLFFTSTVGSANYDQLRLNQLSSAIQQQVPNPFYGHITSGTLSAATVPLSYLIAPFPQYLGLNNAPAPVSSSTYEALQLKAEKRFGAGGSFLVTYAKQKLIGNGSPIVYQNIYDLSAAKSVESFDVPQSLVLSYVYELPFGKGRRFGNSWNRPLGWALGGWQLNGITTFSSGTPLMLSTQNTSGSGSLTLYPNTNGQSALLGGSVKNRLSQYFNTSVFSQPAPFTFGNVGPSLPTVRAPGVANYDLSVFKNFRPMERLTVQFHAEAFNAFNRVQFGAPNQVLSSGQFGVISTQANTPRQIQFALKLLF